MTHIPAIHVDLPEWADAAVDWERRYATDEEIREAARQFVRKVSGFGKPTARHAEAFETAVDEVTDSSRRLLETIDATLRSTA